MKFLRFFAVSLCFFQCATSSTFIKKPPFIVDSASYYKHTGGILESANTEVYIKYNFLDNSFNFEDLYFQEGRAKISIKKIEGDQYIYAKFNSTTNTNNDFILDRDPKKEYGNKPPKQKIPFELKENEAVISYSKNGEIKYFKVENLKKRKTKKVFNSSVKYK